MSVPAPGGIDVHADGSDRREELVHLFLHPLGAAAEIADVPAAALRAHRRRSLDRAAHMAAQLSRILRAFAVQGHAQVALLAFDHIAAASAADEGVVAPAVQEQHGLMAAIQTFL